MLQITWKQGKIIVSVSQCLEKGQGATPEPPPRQGTTFCVYEYCGTTTPL